MNSGTGMRVLTAAILIPIVSAAIWWGPTWLIAIVSAFVAIAAMLEFFSIAVRLGLQVYRLWTCLAAAGLLFVVIPFSAVIRLHGVDVSGPRLLLFTVVLVWVGDPMAYIVGGGI